MKKVLVLCTGNSCRSQMTEGYLRYFAQTKADIYSAGIEPGELNADAVAVMKADGVDISKHTCNRVDEYQDVNFDLVLTVCDMAKETCPVFPSAAKQIHHDFPDPSKHSGAREEKDREFEKVRDMIKCYCHSFVQEHL